MSDRICPTCNSRNFERSKLGPDRCTFCDGTEGGVGPVAASSDKDRVAWALWVMDTLQAIYDAELNCRVSSFWDAGWSFYLGDEVNGFDDRGEGGSLEEVVEALATAALMRYPSLILPRRPNVT